MIELSKQIIEEGNTGKNAIDRVAMRDELKAIERGRVTSLWLNRATTYEKANDSTVLPMTVYKGETASGLPTWNEPVMDMQKYLDGINYVESAIKSGSKVDYGKVNEDPYIGEWSAIAQEYYSTAKKNGGKVRSAAIGTDSDFSAIDVVNVMAQMVNTELRTFTLEQALTVVGTPQLTIKVDTYNRFTAEQGVPEGVMPTPKRASVTRGSFDLTKDVSTIGMTDESQLRLVHDLFKQQIDTAVTDFKRVKANKIAKLLETATTQSGGADWTAFTSDHNTTSPFLNFGAAGDAIFANNGAPNVITSHDKGWRAYTQSSYVKGLLQAIPLPDMSMAKVINQVPAMPGFTWYTDNEHTSTIATVFDRKAVALFQGPVRTAQYRLELEGIDGYIYRDWNLPAILVPGRIRLLTSIAV